MQRSTLDLSFLEPHHRRRLEWFDEHAGATVPFPEPTADGPPATRAKGIYKPAGLDHALSVRVVINSPYADKAVERFPDRAWSLRYFQENRDPAQKMNEYTNRGLDRCQQDAVPVGVMVQASVEPVRYDVLGLALVTGWEAGFFVLESARP